MSATVLDKAISTFERLLPTIVAKRGPSWAVVVDDALQGALRTYGEAAELALGKFHPGAFLIRHTQEQTPYIPFVVVED